MGKTLNLDDNTTDELTLTQQPDGEEESQDRLQAYIARAVRVSVKNLQVGDELDAVDPYRRFAKVAMKKGDRVLVQCSGYGIPSVMKRILPTGETARTIAWQDETWQEIWGPAVRAAVTDSRTKEVTIPAKALPFDSVVEDGRPESAQTLATLKLYPIGAIRLEAGGIDKMIQEYRDKRGPQDASQKRGAAPVGVREEGGEVGAEAPLRQPGEAAEEKAPEPKPVPKRGRPRTKANV